MIQVVDVQLLQRWPAICQLVETACFLRGVGGTLKVGHGFGDDFMTLTHIANRKVLKPTDETLMVAALKEAELVWTGALATPFYQPGEDGRRFATGYHGGLRLNHRQGHYHMAEFSGLPAAHDVLFASLALVGLETDLHTHHGSIRYQTQEAYAAAVALMKMNFKHWAQADTPDGPDHHLRHYGGVYASGSLIGLQELQHFPDETMGHKQEEHLDIATSNPVGAMEQMVALLYQVPNLKYTSEDWGGEGPGPVCMVAVDDFNAERDFRLAVHFRRLTDEHWKPAGIP